MRRREFLTIGSVTGLWVGTRCWAAARPLSQKGEEPWSRPPLDPDWTVGYWQASDKLPEPTGAFRAVEAEEIFPWEVPLAEAERSAPFRPDLVDAAELGADGSLIGKQVRITLIGMQPEPSTWYGSDIQDFYLHAYSAPKELNPDLPAFLFWGFQREEAIKHGAPARCRIQIEAGQDLVFETSDQAFGEWRQSLVLATADTQELPKLRYGVYLIAWRDPNTGEFPDWEDYQLRSSDPENERARKYPYRLEGDRLVMAAFPYFILAVQP